eukprot:1060803-Rhodomonas_salina.2
MVLQRFAFTAYAVNSYLQPGPPLSPYQTPANSLYLFRYPPTTSPLSACIATATFLRHTRYPPPRYLLSSYDMHVATFS